MNVLVVSPQFPYPPHSGFATRVYQLARRLAARHDVTLLSYARPEQRNGVEELREEMAVVVVERDQWSEPAKRLAQLRSIGSFRPFSCRAVHSPEMQRAIDELCARRRFDVVQLESSLLCAFTFPTGIRVVLDEHNIEYELFRRMYEGERSPARRWFNRWEYRRFRRFEQRCWTLVEGCVVTSERERPIVTSSAPETVTAVVPNGVDLDYFRPSGTAVEPHTLVFNGVLDYRPNLDAARHLVEDVWPIVLRRCPAARLTIVGRGYESDVRALRRPTVRLTGEVPDIRPYLERAAVIGVPIRIGGGTRLKVVEGLAMGGAIVSTSLGCEGVAVRDREHLFVADGAEPFAANVLELFDNPSLGRSLGAAGRRLVEREYSWEHAGERLELLHRDVCASRPVRGSYAAASPLPAGFADGRTS